MSTLRCTNLQDTSGGNSLTTAQIYNGAAKAWVNFNGTGTVAIRAQFNVSSITDNGTGDYTVNFSSALADANYTVSGSVVGSTIAQTYSWVGGPPSNANALHSTTAVRFGTIHVSQAPYDQDVVQIIIHR
jgi:hypothetical protein